MKLTKKKAKELAIEKWEWLYHHPSKTDNRYNFPDDLAKKIEEYRAECTLLVKNMQV